MRIIQVKPGSITPVSTTPAPDTTVSNTPLRAKSPGKKQTKEIILSKIRDLHGIAKRHLRNGDRRLISPEAMLWVERPVPSETNTLDVLRGIRDIMARGIPPIQENPEVLKKLRGQFTHALSRAKELWARGAGGQLPRTAYDSAEINPESATIAELKAAIVGLGGTL